MNDIGLVCQQGTELYIVSVKQKFYDRQAILLYSAFDYLGRIGRKERGGAIVGLPL